MEGAGAHSTDRTTGLGSTSRASSSISESTLSGSSTTSDVASNLVSATLGRAADNLNELRQCISRWEAEGHSGTEDHWASHTQQKVEQHLHTFFNLRRVFAEHQGDAIEDILEDLQHWKKSMKANDKSPRRMDKKTCKGFKSVCQCFSISHPKTKLSDEQGLDVAAGSQSSSSTLDSTLHGSSPGGSLHSFQAAEPCVAMSPIMEEDLVTDMDSTPAPSGQDGHLEPSEVHVDEVVGSASSGSYLKRSVKADKKSSRRMDKKTCKGFKSACKCFSISHPKTKVTDEQGLDVVEGSQSSSSTSDSTLHGSSPTASLQAAEPCVAMSPIMEEDLVTDMDSTPAPLGQDGHLEPSEVHVDEVVGSASSGSYLKRSVEADKKSSRRMDKKTCKGFKSACKCFSISHPKTKVTDEQGLDVVEGSQSSSSTSDSTLHGSSPTASLQAAEPCVAMSPIMEEDLVTDMDSTPAPSGQDGHLEPSEVHVDEVVGSASSGSYLKRSVEADKKSSRRMDKKTCKGFKSACKCFSISHPKTKVTDEQGLDVVEGSQSSSLTSDSTLHGSSPSSSLRSFQAAESCVVMSPIMEEDLVTDMDSTPAPLEQDGHVEPSEVRVDEVVGSASSGSYLKQSVKADKKSLRGTDKKICKGFKSACQCFSISHPKTKVTDEQGLDLAEGSQSSSSTLDSTLHGSSPSGSLRSFQAAEPCVAMSPIMEEDLVVDVDSTPAPLGQDGHLEPSEVHVDEVVGSASSGSYLKRSVKADKKSSRRMDKKTCKGFKSACRCFSISHPKTKLTDEQGLDVAEGSQSSSSTLDSTLHGSSPTTSLQAAEPCVVMSPIMEEDLVTDMDSTPAPLGQDGHLEPSEVHVDEVVGSARSGSYLKQSVKADKKSLRGTDKKTCKGFKSACRCFSISHPKTKVTDEQGLDVVEGSQSSSSTLDSTLHGSSPSGSLRSFQEAESCIAMSPIMAEDLVTDMDSTPAPSGQDGHLEPSEVHVDEVVGSASSGSYLKRSVKADKKSSRRMDKKTCKGFKSACKCFSISHPKTKVTDEQCLDVVEGSQSSSSTLDSTLHGSSPSGSLRSFQAAESCVVMSPIMEEDLVTDMDSTPAPLEQDGHVEPSEVHVDEVVGSVSSGSYLKQSVKADKKSLRGTDKKTCKGFKSACQCFSISHPKTKVTDEQGLDLAEGSQSSSSTLDSTLHGSSPSGSLRSFQAAESCVAMSPIMEEDLVVDVDSTPAPSGQDGHLEPSEVHVDEVVGSASRGSYLKRLVKADKKSPRRTDKKICKGFKWACQCFSISQPKTKLTDEQGLDVAEGSQSSSSTLDSTLHGSSPTASLQAAEPCVVMSPIMEEDLVTDMDSTPAPLGQDGHLEPSEVHVDEVVGSASSGSYLKQSVKADKKSLRGTDKKICKGFKSTCQCFSISHPKAKVTDEQGLDVVEGSQSSSSTLDSTLHGSSPSGSLRSFQAVEACVVMSPIMEEDLVTDIDSTLAPLGQDGYLEPSEVCVDEVIGSASSDSYLKRSVKADKKSSRRMDKKTCKGFKSACQCFSISHPKTKVTDEQGLDVVEGSQSSSLTSDSKFHGSSPTASLQAVEPYIVTSPIMEEDLVTDMDSTPAPSGQDGHLEPSEVHVDEVVGSASSGSYLKRSVKADKKSSRRMDKKTCKGFKSACQCFSISHPKTKVTDKQGLDVVEGSQSSSSTLDSTLHGSSPSGSLRSFQAAESCVAMSPIMEEDLVTDMDSTPAPLGQDGHLEPSEVHVDEVVGSASSGSYLKQSVKADKKSSRRTDKKTCKGFKSACQCFSISHPKTKVTDEQGLDVVEGSQSSSLTSDSTLHGSSPTASLQAVEPCVVISPIMEEDLVTDMDLTPAPLGQDGHLEPSEVQVDEVVGSASSGSYLKRSLKANEKSPRRTDKKTCKGFKSACLCFSISHLEPTEIHVGAEQNVDENVDTASSVPTSDSASTRRLSTTVSTSASEDTMTAEEAVTDIDATLGPSMVLSGAGHLDEVDQSASSSSLKNSLRANKKSSGRIGKKIVKGFKCAWQCFSISHPKTKVTDEQGLDVAEGSESYSTCDPTFHESSPTASLQAAEHCDVICPVTEEELVLDMDATPAPLGQDGHLEPSEVHVDEVVGSVSSSSYLKKSLNANEKSPQRMDNKICKGFKSACQCFCMRHLEPSEVHVGAEQNVEENVETASNNLTSGLASPRELCNTFSNRSSEDTWTAEKAEQVTGMTKGTTAIMVSPAPGHVYEVFGSSSTDANLPKPGSPSPPVKDRNQIMYVDSTSRHSGPDRHLEDSQGDKSAVYVIVTGFIDSLTKRQRKEMSRGVYSVDVQKKMSDSFAKGTKVLIKELEAELSASLQRSASQNSSVHTRSSTSSQLCGNEALAWELLSKFTKELDVTDERMRQILNRSGGKAPCDVAAAKTPVSMSSRIIKDTQSTEAVKLILSEPSDQKQRTPETETTRVPKKKSSWWCVCMKKKVDPLPSGRQGNGSGCVELPPVREAWTEAKKNDEAQDEPAQTKQSSLGKKFQCCFSTSRFPPVSLEDQGNGSDCVELPPVRDAWPEVKKNDEAQDKPARTKQASLLRRIRCCLSSECCCGYC